MKSSKSLFILLLIRYKKSLIKKVTAALIVLCVIGYSYLLKIVDYQVDVGRLQLDERYIKDNKKQFSIALITDLHACYYGDNARWLIDELKDRQPDVILLGGDIYDDRRDFDHADDLLSQLGGIAASYYVDGNHENWLPKPEYDKVIRRIQSHGIQVIHGQKISIDGSNIDLYGLSDPAGGYFETDFRAIKQSINPKRVNILLSHRPEYIDEYREYPFDIVLSGHAHGGQWRVPFLVNGVYAPNQGFLPKYAGGLYKLGGTRLIVSRGLARESTKVPRLFNRPELVFVTLTK